MLNRQELDALATLSSEEWPFVSFYCGIDHRLTQAERFSTKLRNLLRQATEAAANLPEDQASSVRADLVRIQSWATDQYVRGSRGLAVVACHGLGLWQPYLLSRPVAAEITVGQSPHLRPLLELAHQQRRYCTVLVSQERARLFLIEGDEIRDHSEVFDFVPGRHDQGGWAQARLQRHHDDRVLHHLKRVAVAIFDLFQAKGFDRLLIGGTEETSGELTVQLHPYLLPRLAGRFAIEVYASREEVLGQTQRIIEDREKKTEKDAVGQLRDEAGLKQLSVCGLRPTLQALQNGQISTLVVNSDFSIPGNRCPSCQFLAVEEGENCPYCQEALQDVADLVENVVERTLDQKGQVEFVSAPETQEELAELGNIGALLRFAIGVESADTQPG
jgi:peptide chain release factor subunit 1